MKNYILPILTACIYTNVQAEPFDIFQDSDVCPEMVEMPLGDFLMGTPQSEFERTDDYIDLVGDPPNPDIAQAVIEHFFLAKEIPVHTVEIDVPFAIGRNEVTYDQWMACISDGGCNGYVPEVVVRSVRAGELFKPILHVTGSYPVLDVSYLNAVAYTDWLNLQIGTEAYRLPTEAEWEYAARAGTQTMFAQGDDVTPDQVNYRDIIQLDDRAQLPPETIVTDLPVPVEELDAANPWGLRHMSGNAREWTSTCFIRPYEMSPLSSIYLEKVNEAISCARSMRGAAFDQPRHRTRVAAAYISFPETFQTRSTGLRVVRNLAD